MKRLSSRSYSAFTLTEALVCVVVFGALLAIALANTAPKPTRMIQVLSNMKQLHLATQQMALDAETTGDTNIGWPGDTGGTMTNWARRLVPEYLSTNDFCKLMSVREIQVTPSQFPNPPKTAILVYAVREADSGNVVFLSTANFTNTPEGGMPLNAKAVPYGERGFLIFRKAGDGDILQPKQVGNTNLIGGYVPLCK